MIIGHKMWPGIDAAIRQQGLVFGVPGTSGVRMIGQNAPPRAMSKRASSSVLMLPCRPYESCLEYGIMHFPESAEASVGIDIIHGELHITAALKGFENIRVRRG